MSEHVHTHAKALAVNLDRTIYGTFAEIGAGQEVARWFYRVGGAAGTVAKTISAYDMAVSDAIYGKAGRYVSRERLVAMLEHEYALLVERLDASHGETTRFFAFADTVAARNYAGTNECHGWIGLRFQTAPRGAPSDILLHVNLRDPANLLQQEALGVLGVNLVHGAFHERETPAALFRALFADLALARLEIDAVELRGPAFEGVDGRRLHLHLVREGYANLVLFGADGRPATPSEALRKRPILLERGLFRSIAPVHAEMLSAAATQLRGEVGALERDPLPLFEMTVVPARAEAVPSDDELLARADRLVSPGAFVAVSRFALGYGLVEYLRRYTVEPIRFVTGVASLVEIFEASYYPELVGGLLEALGKLFSDKFRVYACPMPAAEFRATLGRSRMDPARIEYPSQGLVSASNIRLAPPVGHLFRYLLESGWIVSLEA